RIAEVICSLEEKVLCQVFFVIGDSFDREEIKKYNLLKQKIIGEDITKYVTISRTNSPVRVYQPQNLKKVTAKIKESLIKKKELEQKLVNLKKTEKQQVKELKSEIQKESKNIRQYLKEISWNNVATTTQTVAGVA
ncbi:16349_t:CDS:2, partial [Entrophospora sp. SA101]